MSADNTADAKAKLAAVADRLGPRPRISYLGAGPLGSARWGVSSGSGGVMVVMPRILSVAPEDLLSRYRDRILSNALGRCPRCGSSNSVLSPSSAALGHEPDCVIADFTAADQQWLDQGEGE